MLYKCIIVYISIYTCIANGTYHINRCHLRWGGCFKMVFQRNNWEVDHRPYHAQTLATNPMGTRDICWVKNSRSRWNLMESHRTMIRPWNSQGGCLSSCWILKKKSYPWNDLVTVWNLTEKVTSRDHQKGKGETKSSKQPCFWGLLSMFLLEGGVESQQDSDIETRVDGRNPAPADMQLISLSHYLQRFLHPRWWSPDFIHQQYLLANLYLSPFHLTDLNNLGTEKDFPDPFRHHLN